LGRKISGLFRVERYSSEESLVRSLIEGIRKQMKYLESERKKTVDRERIIRNKIEKAGGDPEKDLKLAGHEEETEYFSQHICILKKKLELAETRLEEIARGNNA
jgi:hypothetical protein